MIGLKGRQYAGRSERAITTCLLNANPTQPEDHRPQGEQHYYWFTKTQSHTARGSPAFRAVLRVFRARGLVALERVGGADGGQ